MGIHIYSKKSKNMFSCSYITYFFLRKEIAKLLGFSLEIDGNFQWVKQDWSLWDRDILFFLTHSDCSGYITPKRCGIIFEKIKYLEGKFKDISQNKLFEELLYMICYCHKNNDRLYFS